MQEAAAGRKWRENDALYVVLNIELFLLLLFAVSSLGSRWCPSMN